MKISLLSFVFCLLSWFLLFSCNGHRVQNTAAEKPVTIVVPAFSADSAFEYVEKQVNFGARVPNSAAHEKCAAYLAEKLKNFGAEVVEQKANIKAWDNKMLNINNIIGSFQTEKQKRIVLFAHWDTRPWADNDTNEKHHKTAIDGANDGASGVGVLLEIARILQNNPTNVGVDIIFFDAEDYGVSEVENSYCLGTQYWTHTPHKAGYRAMYGILLDMVGAANATFFREQISDYYAKNVVDKIWQKATTLGFANYFINQKGGGITDDHLYVNQLAGIPSIDIIDYNPNTANGFAPYWHTVNDNMTNINKNTLAAVGTILLNVIFEE